MGAGKHDDCSWRDQVFYEQTLNTIGRPCGSSRPPREFKLPVVLSREEVRLVLSLVRIPVYRTCLTTIYSCGLRLDGRRAASGGRRRKAAWSCASRQGKRERQSRCRNRPSSMLREFWKTHRSSQWLFPAPPRRASPRTWTKKSARSPVRACRAPFTAPGRKPELPKTRTYTHCAIPMPRI